jgi:chromosome partitioning protein
MRTRNPTPPKSFIHPDIEIGLEKTLYNVILKFAALPSVVRETPYANLHFAPAHIRLSGIDLELAQALDNRAARLKRAIDEVRSRYDYVIIDTPPSLGLLTINSFVASDQLLIPVSTAFFAMTGLVQLQETIEMVRQNQLNAQLEIIGVLCTFSEHTNVLRDVEQQLRQFFGGLVFQTTIPKNISLEEAHSRHTHVFDHWIMGSLLIETLMSRNASSYSKRWNGLPLFPTTSLRSQPICSRTSRPTGQRPRTI